ncbi:NAD(P)-dependent oxidoreductase [Deinococcus peraridilitoris]|uniref:Beta-hydroxyacid dehydrogenase, 3-hydroxyisobutyrate dehydrogenase n=1 Tax=Deinococcus peraridilitoris (strain DSM 19664 / LMG 22246 / CIP 109416 / KR-200) TaxID=937777 RepID=L0A0L8_DEIPD|nr:NAD(P)-dependent oxidoreductase [Deinococcus peraridilitoris]AFZ66550.1 beta-hydroxyacid dehydrogenase, 3-hydroxyisobutyrate dehydrogenase [Deinococcus peraridilitoris DSM 19664]
MNVTVAFVGLGAMGYPMAAHLSRRFETLVWNRTHEKALQHAAEYGSRAVTSVAAAAEADILFTCLPTSAEVAALAGDVISGAGNGLVWVDCTSGDPEVTRELAVRLAGQGIEFVDAPLSGGTAGAEAGKLSVMFGGAESTLEEVRPALEAFATKIVRVGEVGSGHAVKAINNALLAVNLWAAGEGLAALAALGVDVGAALEVINASSGRSNVTENLIPQRVLTRTFPATFKLALLAKDAGLAMDVVRGARASAPVIAMTESLIRAAVNEIGPDEDHTAALKLIERWSKTEIR